jgi:hypothetical protein
MKSVPSKTELQGKWNPEKVKPQVTFSVARLNHVWFIPQLPIEDFTLLFSVE